MFLLITLSLCDCIVLLHNKIIIKKPPKTEKLAEGLSAVAPVWTNRPWFSWPTSCPPHRPCRGTRRSGFCFAEFLPWSAGVGGRRETKGNGVRGNKQFHGDRRSLLEVSPRCSRLFTRHHPTPTPAAAPQRVQTWCIVDTATLNIFCDTRMWQANCTCCRRCKTTECELPGENIQKIKDKMVLWVSKITALDFRSSKSTFLKAHNFKFRGG